MTVAAGATLLEHRRHGALRRHRVRAHALALVRAVALRGGVVRLEQLPDARPAGRPGHQVLALPPGRRQARRPRGGRRLDRHGVHRRPRRLGRRRLAAAGRQRRPHRDRPRRPRLRDDAGRRARRPRDLQPDRAAGDADRRARSPRCTLPSWAGWTGCSPRSPSRRACGRPASRCRSSSRSGPSSSGRRSGWRAWCRGGSAARTPSGSRGCRSARASRPPRCSPTG